ncbi:MAG TPA: hypothetical protein VFW66_11775 [Gemmatimonadales bacterium]|nr:hypothetical protein [Gemmatimonadales bacterium]
MKAFWMRRARLALLLGLAGALPGCLAAAAAAGAGTGIYLTSRGAESVVNGTVSDVAGRARSVLMSENVTINANSTENSGDKQELKGTKGDLDITITMNREGPSTTKTEVTARKNAVEWDKDYAQTLLNKIVKSGAS